MKSRFRLPVSLTAASLKVDLTVFVSSIRKISFMIYFLRMFGILVIRKSQTITIKIIIVYEITVWPCHFMYNI